MLTRRTTLAALAGLAAMRGARAEDFPNHAITIVVPYPAGGPVDLTARLIAQSVGTSLGQPMLVDNRGGGAGVIGSVAVAHAEPDGHTLILGTTKPTPPTRAC
jgi:tripartite-type tricarboxylate transporter receptor subunit TctC